MTDLSAKFSGLETTLVGKLDVVIARLDSVITALTSSSGNIDAAPIVAAIESMRGVGPENTIKSLNQSVWNIAGQAPGKSLAEIYTLLVANHAANGIYLAAIGADTDATATALGVPTGDATTTALGMLYSLQYALTYKGANAANLFGTISAINDAIGGVPNSSLALTTVRGLISQLMSAVGKTNKLLDPISASPVDLCQTPFISNGTSYQGTGIELAGITLLSPVTVATWPNNPPSGITVSFELLIGDSKLQSADWGNWRIYVASSASLFGVVAGSSQRFVTNSWVSMPSPNAIYTIFVDGNAALTAYICPSAQLVEGIAPTGTDFTSSTDTSVVDGRRYLVWPDLEGLTESAGGIELTPASTWSGYEVYIQTGAPNATLHDITEPVQNITGFVVNQWNALGNNHTLAFSVDAAYLAKGYMRVPVMGTPTEPFIIWQGTDVQGTTHSTLGDWYYFVVEIPEWADRVRVETTTSYCFGNLVWYYENYLSAGYIGGGCFNSTLTPPTGVKYIGINTGALDQRCSGTIWAIPEGYEYPA